MRSGKDKAGRYWCECVCERSGKKQALSGVGNSASEAKASLNAAIDRGGWDVCKEQPKEPKWTEKYKPSLEKKDSKGAQAPKKEHANADKNPDKK